ncbi:hypothetical protein ASF60_22065 [Methylobacterium sp. Leaf113]|uniref:hypothetical protein n=1 Tax=Methylobacterium sp. Leaf113 TaxID=1736259 RepID=UPI0006F35E83|nr:hypothetical protein [Methylobacterium sp. Leaf113]KQP83412.1 hypothetical protein ASF60_22065 [Methylobacterium sp. Leaf113]
MSEWVARSALLVAFLVLTAPALAEPSVTILDLPFRAKALRGPGSEVAIAVATSGLLPLARSRNPNPTGIEQEAPIVVVWGDGGGAALSLVDGQVATTLLGAEAIEGLAAAETPRGALPGSRRAVSGPLSAYLANPVPGLAGGPEQAASLVIRERQPVAMGGDPKPVPIVTTTLAAAPDTAFALRRPRIARFAEKPVIVAVIVTTTGASELALFGRAPADAKPDSKPGVPWSLLARSPAQETGSGGQPLKPAGIADFAGAGQPQIAAVANPEGAGLLQLWALESGALRRVHEAPGYTNVSPGEGEVDLSALVEPERAGPPELALPVADRSALAILVLKDGIRERLRIPLPGLAAFGLASLGRGPAARLLVGLADGRIAVVTP